MSIVKNTPHYLKHHKKRFTTIQNETIEAIKDAASLGIYLYLSSKPDDWEISETHLKNRFGKGRDFIRARLADLKRIGLLQSVSFRNEKGVITHWETVLYNEVQVTEKAPCGNKDIQNPENPPSGETSNLGNPPTTNNRLEQIKDSNITHTGAIEDDLFFDEEQHKKAMFLRKQCEKNQKCKELYEQLPAEVKDDKTFEDIHNECVIHYATQGVPQLVSYQRLISWIKRDITYHKRNQAKEAEAPKGKSGDALSRVAKQYMNQGATYDHATDNTIDPLR